MDSTKDFTALAKFFHWLMAAVIIVGWFVGFYAVQLLKPGLGQDEIITLHKDIATPALLLIVLRSLWRVTHRPPHVAYKSAFQRFAVQSGHFLLYALMFVMPFSGWLDSSAAGYPIEFAGIIPLPPLVPKNLAMDGYYNTIHCWVGYFTGVVILGHVVMALKHHFIDRDHTLRGMLPRCKSANGTR